MAATFFQSVMEGERRRVSPKPSQALSPNDLGDSFGARIYRDAKTRAVFPSRYSGKAKLAQFSVLGISALKPLTGTAGMPLGTITGGKDRNNRGRCEH